MRNLKATIQIAEDEEFRKGLEQLAQSVIEKYIKNDTTMLSASIEIQKFMLAPDNKKKIMEMIDAAIKAKIYEILFSDGEIVDFIHSAIQQAKARVEERMDDAHIQDIISTQAANLIAKKLKGI